MPELWLCSPLTRTADTMRLSFGDILDGKQPIFVEVRATLVGKIVPGLTILFSGYAGDIWRTYL